MNPAELVSRRTALAAFGALGAVALGGRAGGSIVAPATGSLSCVVTPAETEGPFFVDERLNRSNLTGGTSRAGVAQAVPLGVRIAVYRAAGSTCTPLAGAMVDVWHCDAGGAYSDVAAENTAGQTFLRGYQLTDANGVATFATVYPGWYRGRTVHVHFKVRTLAPSGTTSFTFNSQLFFDESVSNAVFANAPYNARGARTTGNANDGIYNSALLLPVTKTAQGYAGTFSVGLNLG